MRISYQGKNDAQRNKYTGGGSIRGLNGYKKIQYKLLNKKEIALAGEAQ